MTPAWLKFEEAIATFLAALAPGAKVIHNKSIPDRDTGVPRQRDVWIETSFGGHFAIKILVSCKRLKRKLDSQHIDAFIGELRSSGANKGVIYSMSGFTRPALDKAEKLGISCCVLLVDAPPPIPEILLFDAYHLSERFRLVADGLTGPLDWLAMLNADSIYNGQEMPAHEALARLFADDLAALRDALGSMTIPRREVMVTLAAEECAPPLRLGVRSEWVAHRARIEAWLVSGSYSFSERDFQGSFATPAIDTWSLHPGPGWKPVDLDAIEGGNMFRFYQMLGDIGPRLAEMAENGVDTTSATAGALDLPI